MPAILIEVGSHDNLEDAKKLINSYRMDKVADAIVEGVNEYFES